MAQLDWGKGRIGLHFKNDSEYYEALGYISNEYHNIDVYTHDNDESGAWAGQGKLHNHRPLRLLPPALKDSLGLSGDDRLSVTDYVANLINSHSFTRIYDPTGNRYTYYRTPSSLEDVMSTVPDIYLSDFNRGYNMP